MDDRIKIAQFDRYLRGEMTESERADFEVRLQNSERLQQELVDYIQDCEKIELGTAYIAVKNLANDLHQELYSKKQPQAFKAIFWLPVGLAACVAVFFLFFTDIIFTPTENLSEAKSSDNIEMNAVDSTNNKEPLVLMDSIATINTPSRYTALQLNQDGYFLLSKNATEFKDMITLQQKDLNLTFEARVIYQDSGQNFSIVKSSEHIAKSLPPPLYKIATYTPKIGDPLALLNYANSSLTYTPTMVTQEQLYKTFYIEIDLRHNENDIGSPVFDEHGYLLGIITDYSQRTSTVINILKAQYIFDQIKFLPVHYPAIVNEVSNNSVLEPTQFIQQYRQSIFEVF